MSEAAAVPTARARLAAALVVATLAGIAAGLAAGTTVASGVPGDFEFWWRGTRLWASGVNPYTGIPHTASWPLPDPLFYPMPALVLTWPLHALGLPVAAGIFMAISTGLLVWALSARGWWRLWLLAGAPYVMAVKIGQWSPLLVAGALLPSAAIALAAKPTLGAALAMYRLDRRAMFAAAAFGIATLVLLPSWPTDWLRNLQHVETHPPPIATFLAPAFLLLLLRWRQPEARLLLALACVPQLLFFADQLAVGLVARTRSELTALVALQLAAWGAWWALVQPTDAYVNFAATFVLVGVYLPAVVVIMRRPNVGSVPRRVEEWLARARVPTWLRGQDSRALP